VNLGTDKLVSINELADLIQDQAGTSISYRHDLTAPQGVRGRNSDNSRLTRVLGWQPTTTLEIGLAPTYKWIEDQIREGQQSIFPNLYLDPTDDGFIR
jgi:nucleoside-diphosphate-sugar epimerase